MGSVYYGKPLQKRTTPFYRRVTEEPDLGLGSPESLR
jgi:hypothetical protein